jgi:MoaA/NifB/PqqE/SkfB family radical SAM enzyme
MKTLSRLYNAWSLKAPEFPRRLQIETTNRCNSACAMCPILTMTRPKGEMSPALWARLVAELKARPALRRVMLHVMGEPLLHPRFVEMVEELRAQAPHQPVEFSTNGSLLTPPAAERLVLSGVRQINFSLDACTPETHARVRKGLNFDKVTANLAGLIETVARLGQTRPKVLVQLIKMDVNKDEWAAFARRWEEVAAKHPFVRVYLKEQWSWGGYLDSGQAQAEAAQGGLAMPCSFPFDQLDVYWDGTVGFCCLDEDAHLAVGDLNRESLADIWASPRLEEMRRKFKRLDFTGLRCAGCGERLRRRPWSELGERPRAVLRRLGLGRAKA